MKKIIMIIMALILLVGCTPENNENDKIKIVATLFPQYDFAKVIAGEYAEVSLLIPPGVESHSFELSPADIIRINESDLFIYTSKYMEPWADKMVLENETKAAVWQAASGINHKEHGGDIDPHVWTNPQNAILMAQNVLNALCTIDVENSEYYTRNYNALKDSLEKIDKEIENTVKKLKYKKLVFGTKFSLHYFAERYALEHISAFDSCGHESEPSPKVMAKMIDAVKKEKIPAVYYGEMENTKVAQTIADESGAKMLMLHSCHNLTKEEFLQGETYISIMKKNILNLKEGLSE